MTVAKTQLWHTVDSLPCGAVEVVARGDEAQTVEGLRHYYVLLSRGEYWLYRRDYHPGRKTWETFERELIPARPGDAHWIAGYRSIVFPQA